MSSSRKASVGFFELATGFFSFLLVTDNQLHSYLYTLLFARPPFLHAKPDTVLCSCAL